MNIRNTVLINNLLLWFCSFVLFLFLFSEDGQPKTIDFIYTGSFLATLIIPVLINFYILIPHFLKKERYLFYALTFIGNILIFTQLNIWFFEHFIDYIFPDYYFISYHSNITLFTIFTVFLIITTMINFSMDWFYFNSQENRELKIRNQQIQTQLSSLRSQINPHFLFNSLNVIYALAIENNAETKDAIVQLSDILRYIIYDSNTKHVTLKEEVKLLKNYIEFQHFRHQQNDNITFNCSIADENYPIYPMLLLPLVENSFKYGIKGDISNTFIRMDLKQEKNEFLFDIENNYSEMKLDTNGQSGLGLENIRKNLEIVYPNKHEFNITKNKDTFKVSLKLYSHED
ncbi:sensor histidine kinase [Flavobacteriaceae bacterium LMO-SS05]